MAERRWSARDCHEFFEQRPWDSVLKFYQLVVNGQIGLRDLRIEHNEKFEDRCLETKQQDEDKSLPIVDRSKERGGRWERRTFKIVLSYSGTAFAGWQKQPGFLTVQSVLEKQLGRFVDGKRASNLEKQGKIKEALVSVAGRTDKGVHACGQVCSFYTWMRECKEEDVKSAVNSAMPTILRAVSASEVDRDFHPIFSAKWRRYIYIFPLRSRDEIDVSKVATLLRGLEGHSLSYAIFARDTKIARSSGPATVCTLYHARAALAKLPVPNEENVMVVELVADRFLRKMVRVLVSTAIKEAFAGANDDALVALMEETDRRASAPPAPAHGLCLAEVGYGNSQARDCLLRHCQHIVKNTKV
ncbi:uncharacterized protein LOC9662101 [Selaginella moellendorffii]|uniref:uncharacterized protein LOC9662101 n=1 Tax=Selaginella moellendorffii TaxID=88036 RepID=UPI000D1C5E7C|nr:uncharacterized protein LOC9662101 [Selaginella moellendorffii]|eukprot:XP_024543716.1 uncharacterized protein LOC9662101 [Selaginella moellendorffii]